MNPTIVLFGAAGKIGTRISNNLCTEPDLIMLYVEAGEAGQARLHQRGLTPADGDAAVAAADVIILAIPDTLIGKVAAAIVPTAKSGAMIICLDPAAPYGGELPARPDITYVVTHPCHPPVINDETDAAARLDFFGGKAKQHVVLALMQGPEADYAVAESLVRKMFAPVMNVYRVTVEQMAILEPALSETVVLTCMFVMKEAIGEAVRRGVPEQVARDFVLGHINVNLGILFKYIDADFSDGAKLAVQRAKQSILKPDWQKVFEQENVLASVKAITRARQGK